ncbi:MAG TPA: hypothetical protein VGN26_21530, partial [Armatimonadota bacterium]|jgi:exopolyphosphatase/guanosine-5'-triphosphate,3'-diphosphate pyrophosphatase
MVDGVLSAESVARTLEALGGFHARCEELGVKVLRAAGTSALRDARNAKGLLAHCPFPVEVLTGEEEARVSYLAARRFAQTDAPAETVLDLGGGSTEVITGPAQIASYQVGATRLTQDCLRGDPPTAQDVRRAEAAASEALSGAPTSARTPAVLVGSTGLNVAGLVEAQRLGAPSGVAMEVEGYRLTRDDVCRQRVRLTGLTVDQIRALPGIRPERAPILLGGLIALQALLDQLALTEVTLSGKGLRYGLVAALCGDA